MRKIARVDSNQKEITLALRAIGASVLPLHQIGRGAPDLAVGFRGQTFFLEVKDGSKPPSAQKLTEDERTFQVSWRGHYAVVTSADEAMQAIGAISGKGWKLGHSR